jgi:hypothetical protein
MHTDELHGPGRRTAKIFVAPPPMPEPEPESVEPPRGHRRSWDIDPGITSAALALLIFGSFCGVVLAALAVFG